MRIDTISQWLHRLIAEGNQVHIRIAFDEENNAQTWIDAARERINDAPACLRPLLQPFPPESVTVSPAEALAALEWASTLPGWEDGPEYASTALTFHEDEG